jgi:hypothetical protein
MRMVLTKRKHNYKEKCPLWLKLNPVAGYTLLNQKRSPDIRSELKIVNLTERIETWHDHIMT